MFDVYKIMTKVNDTNFDELYTGDAFVLMGDILLARAFCEDEEAKEFLKEKYLELERRFVTQ